MAKRSELRTIDLEDDTCENIPKTLHLVFIRITVENKLKKQELIERILDIIKTNYPNWNNNRYFKMSGTKLKIVCYLAFYRQFWLLKILKKVSGNNG